MKYASFTLRSLVAPFAVAAFGLLISPLPAQTALTSWTSAGTGPVSSLGTSSPVLGNGGASSTEGAVIYSTFAGDTLNNVGDSILFSGTISFTAAAPLAAAQLRWGLENTNAQSGTTGWLGYWAGNSGIISGTDTSGALQEMANPNTTSFSSGLNGSNAVASATANAALGSGTYAFTLKYQKQSATSLLITWTLSNGSSYALSGSYLDTSVATFTFNSAFVSASGGFDSTQASLSNMAITEVPEPASLALLSLAGLGLAVLRRRTPAAAL